jgi:hypothetical protein
VSDFYLILLPNIDKYTKIIIICMSSITIQKQEIATILELIVEQSETILAYPEGQIPQIELDIACENIRKLYNNYSILDKINSLIIDRVTQKIVDDIIPQPVKRNVVVEPVVEFNVFSDTPEVVKLEEPKPEIAEPVKEKIPEEVVTQIEPTPEVNKPISVQTAPVSAVLEEVIVETVTETIQDAVIPEIAEVQPEPAKTIEPEVVVYKPEVKEIPEPVAEPVLTEVVAEVEISQEPVVEKPAKPVKEQKHSTGNLFDTPAPSIADTFKDNKPSLHEKIGSVKSDNSLASKFHQKPIADLVKSIGINDKFLFIKELFQNNGEEYNETIQLLNNFSSLMQAFEYLDVLKQKYGWDESSDASLKLYDLIRRKYQQ